MTDSQRPPMPPPPGSRGMPPGMPPGPPPARRMPGPETSAGATQRPTEETVAMPNTARTGMPPTTSRPPSTGAPPTVARTPGAAPPPPFPTAAGAPPAPPAAPSAPPRQQPPAPPAAAPAAPPASAGGRTPGGSNGRSPGQPTLAEVVRYAFDNGISDIHVGVGEAPRFRKRGDIILAEYPEVDYPTFMSWMQEVMSDEEIQKFEEHLDFDGVTQYEFSRARINVFGTMRGPAMVMRLIPNNILSMEQLNLPPVFKDICHYHKGLILVTGPTGSGKSTTMAAMIDYINKNMAKHIITIEDPIEFVHVSRKSLIKHREVGQHTRKFDNALKAALREDPDLILVGEMRDKETVNTALKAAQTGHLVAGTLHTNSAVKTIERILNLYSAEEQNSMKVAIAESLVAVVAQGLCKTTDGKRAAYHDILINTDAIKEYIIQGKYEEITGVMLKSKFDGMQTMNQALLALYQEGRITEEEALERSPTPNEMAQFLRGRV
ncbi:type IV pilus twitching motility protein PilT [Planktothrix sp. FACHB-1355]|uniref:Type IV pilus twitching motility protein PilT n=2 Tax=Oscillatoriophycideae TaxID=1301283 RepID=A0A926VBY6_9CYAN|nr:type IV pilus twitching motility protein PilT [Planktothrix sp. FACHB-1355]MBD2180132.1 type IV pilus twitching motility protein PilT [Aerosakkonema funiforme FACHB-1375]MBD3557776.1 type IV pilus twitching motility protein PilT [Planktothrix sp. FACHB-1355]